MRPHTTVTLCTKCEFLQFWISTIMWGDSRLYLTDGFLRLWIFVPSSQRLIHLIKMPSYFSCESWYNGWNLNASSFRNVWRTRLDTSSGFNYRWKSGIFIMKDVVYECTQYDVLKQFIKCLQKLAPFLKEHSPEKSYVTFFSSYNFFNHSKKIKWGEQSIIRKIH